MQLISRSPDKGYLDTHLWLPKSVINVDAIKSALTYTGAARKATDEPRIVQLWQETQHHLKVPRNFWNIAKLNIPVVDCRPTKYKRTKVTSNIKLDHRVREVDGEKVLQPTGKTTQRDAMAALLKSTSGILQLACGLGKTVVALDFIAEVKGPAIIILDNSQLLQQWTTEIDKLLNVPGGVGLVKADKFDWKKDVVLCTYQTLANISSTVSEEFRRYFQLAIWDEGHHVSAPTFAPGAELFYGYRLSLTATPERDDGLHIIYEMHIGPVLYRNLHQDLNARTAFDYTGLQLDINDPECDVIDVSGELNLGKLSVYYGRWKAHLNHVIKRVTEAVKHNRRVLVLCASVDEAINLCAMWNGVPELYTDVPMPTLEEVGEVVDEDKPIEPKPLTGEELEARHTGIKTYQEILDNPESNDPQKNQAKYYIDIYKREIEGARLHAALMKEYRKRQKYYRENVLTPNITTGGLMVYKIDPKERQHYLETKQVVFAIKKYGREGLNNKALDTVLTTMPFSSANTLQQVKGRVERDYEGKEKPLLLVVEHNIAPVRAMCGTLQRHLRSWPVDKGGPFDFELHNYPGASRCLKSLFG